MRGLVYGSVCSGIEAASVAWHPLGWRGAFVSDIEAFPRAVLQHRWPGIPLHGDFTTIGAGDYEPIDVLVGGTPCQSFSVAGLRGGMGDGRGGLALEYLRLAQRLRPRWLVWENVPGVLSSSGGRDFGSILGGMAQLGYGFAYRVLDAQHFGVPQRRRRVFVVGHLGDWRRAAAVLFERHGLSRHPPPRREAREGLAPTVAGGARKRGGYSTDDIPLAGTLTAHHGNTKADHAWSGQIVPRSPLAFGGNDRRGPIEVSTALSAHGGPCGRMDFDSETFVAHTLKAEGFDASEDGTGRGTPIIPVCFSAKDHGADAMSDLSPTLRAGGHSKSHANAGVMPAIAYGITRDAIDRSGEGSAGNAAERSGLGIVEELAQTIKAKGPGAVAFALRGREGGAQPELGGDVSNALRTPGGGASVPMIAASAVRRLTPRECERLQGFPDGYTRIPWRGGWAPDGPRYKALGNSMAVPVMEWIGRRIGAVDAMQFLGEVA